MSAILSIALPVFAVIAAGMVGGRLGILPKTDVAALNRFVFNFAMPAALFGLTSKADPLTISQLTFAAGYAIVAIIVIFSTYFFAKRFFQLNQQEAGAHALTSILGNAVFLGLPIALKIPGWAENFVVLMLVEGVFIIAIGAALMSPRSKGGPLSYLSRPFRNPLVAAMLAGLAFSMISHPFGFDLPGPVRSFFDILGTAAGPTALFSLGLFLATNPPPQISAVGGKVATIVIVKMIILPVLTLGMLYFMGITDPTLIGPAALFTLVPTGVAVFVFANQYGYYATESAAAIAVTTAISVLTISGVLAILA